MRSATRAWLRRPIPRPGRSIRCDRDLDHRVVGGQPSLCEPFGCARSEDGHMPGGWWSNRRRTDGLLLAVLDSYGRRSIPDVDFDCGGGLVGEAYERDGDGA